MGDVVDLQARVHQKLAATGDVSFMACTCGYPHGMFPVMLHDAGPPLIVALVCPGCEAEVAVNGGRLQI